MSKFPDKRLRFSVEQDMQLLAEVLKQNPFEDTDRWGEIHENFVQECNVPFSLRTCKDHVNHLLNLHLKRVLKVRPRETPDDFEQKKKCLDQILNMRKGICSDYNAQKTPRPSVTTSQIICGSMESGNDCRFIKSEDSDDDFYWDEENERDKREKEREANDLDGKLSKQELALKERELTLREQKLKLEEERLELDMMERNERAQMEKAEREAYRNVAVQNQAIVSALMDRFNGGNGGNNLYIL
ncbi:uncharacterized protein [Euwallacea similis]|uniref:uncharacterized protein n=1 Tax=Euwallacea similis TaxID=1736056 RepID=UPI00345104FE